MGFYEKLIEISGPRRTPHLFGVSVYQDTIKHSPTGHYLGYVAEKQVDIYPFILQKMLVRVGGSLNCPPSTFNNVLGWGMKEYELANYELMHNTASVCVQRVLAAKDRARYILGSNIGTSGAPGTTFG